MRTFFVQRVGKTTIKSIILFFSFGIITFFAQFIFRRNLFDEEMLSAKAVDVWNFAFLLLIFESTVFAFHRYSEKSKCIFLEKYARSPRLGVIKSVFLSGDFYLEFVCVVILSLVFPLSFVYDCVGVALFQTDYEKAQVLLVVLPLLFALDIIAHLTVRNIWVSESIKTKGTNEKTDKGELARTVKGVGFVAMIYSAAALVIPWYLPFFITLGNLGKEARCFLYIALLPMIAMFVIVTTYYIRAINKRKRFVKMLKQKCLGQSIALSDIRKPYLSIFFQQQGIDFTLKKGLKVYNCKFVSGVFPSSPIIFSDEGQGIRQNTLRLFRVDLLYLNTRIDYRMVDHSNGARKIIVVLPVPQNIYVSVGGSAPRAADTGEVLGEYILYTATGFLNAIERGQLE